MSLPERLFIKRLHTCSDEGDTLEELRVCLVNDLGIDPGHKPVLTAAPRPADLAFVVARATDGWLVEFLRDLRRRDPLRAAAVSGALHGVEFPQAGEALVDQVNIDALTGKCMRLEKQLRAQRAELRRFNREARARAEGRDSVLQEPLLPLPPGHVIPTFYVDQAKGDTLKDAFERKRVSAGIPGPVAAGEADDVTWSDTELVDKVFEIITSQELPFATERATTEAVEFLRALGEHLERDR